jgi:hypothetical protein
MAGWNSMNEGGGVSVAAVNRVRSGAAASRSLFGLGLAEPGDAVAGFPLATLLEQINALEAFHYVAFFAGRTGRAQTRML